MNWFNVMNELFNRSEEHYKKAQGYINEKNVELAQINMTVGDTLFGIAKALREGMRDESDKDSRTNPTNVTQFRNRTPLDLQRP